MIKSCCPFIMFIGLVGLILCTGNSPCYAEDVSTNNKSPLYWLNAGFGISSIGPSGGVGFSCQLHKDLISIRYVRGEEFQIFESSPKEMVWDVAALYGRSVKSRSILASISGGIGIAGGVRRGKRIGCPGWFSCNYEKLTFRTVGFALEAQLFLTSESGGIGIYGFANFNQERSFGGALLCLQIGKLR